jgi:general secretion pathway protein J
MGVADARGFTLLEILVAIFIFGVILSTIYTSYTRTFRNVEETQSRAEIDHMARIALERIVEDLESVYASERTGNSGSEADVEDPSRFVGEDAEVDGRSADTLRFLSRAHVVLEEGGETTGAAKIIYEVRQSEEEQGFLLYRSDTPELEERPTGEAGGVLLCEGLYSLNFIYYDDNGDAHESWDSTMESTKNTLPSRISIQLEFVNRLDPEGPLRFQAGVVLPVVRNSRGKAS